MPQIIGDLFQRPASLAGTMRKIVAQIMKREVSDQLPLLAVSVPFEATEPLVNAIFGETRTPLGGKDIRAALLAPAMLEILKERTACLVQQIDVTKLLALVSDVQPANLWTDMGVFYEQMRDITHAAPRPVPQSEDGFAAQVALLLKQSVQDEPLVRGEHTWSQCLLRFDLHPTGRVACQGLLLLNEPLAKAVDHRFDTGAVADTIPLLLEDRQIPFHCGRCELGRNKLPALSWKLRHPRRELAQDAQISIHRGLVFLHETILLIVLNPCGSAHMGKRNKVGRLAHCSSLTSVNISAVSLTGPFVRARRNILSPRPAVEHAGTSRVKAVLSRLRAEGIFCHDFSALSQCSRKTGPMQVGRACTRKRSEKWMKQAGGYFALHVSVAHFTPSRAR